MSLQAFNKLVSILSSLLKRNDAYSRISGPISPVIIVGIGTGTLQEASWPIFDMFSEYQLQRPTTASSASLTPFYVVNP